MGLLLLVFGGIAAWLGVVYAVERPHIPAWQARNAYRTMGMVLLLILLTTTYKAIRYHDELVMQIRLCR